LSKVDKATLPTQQLVLNNATTTVKMKIEIVLAHTTTTVFVTSYHTCGCLILCWWKLCRI